MARSISDPLMDAFDLAPRYIPCRCDGGGFWKRLGHAVLFNYVTWNDKQKKVPHFPRFLAAFAGEFASQATLMQNLPRRAEVAC